VANAGELPASVRSQLDRLDRRRLVAYHRIHLRARQLDADGPVERPGGDRGQQRVRPDVSLAAEAAAQEMGYDGDLLERNAKHDRNQFLGAEDVLGGLVECQPAARIPGRHRRVRLHLIMVAIRCRVGVRDPKDALANALLGVADGRGDWPQELWRIDRRLRRLPVKEDRPISPILDGGQRCGVHGLVASRCDDQGDRLAGIMNFIVLQGKIALAVRMKMTPWLWRRVHARHVAMREDRQHARRLLGGPGIDRYRPTVGDGAMDHDGVRGIRKRDVRRIDGPAGHLQPSIGPRNRRSDCVHLRPPATCNARKTARLARACRQLSQMTLATRWTAARKLRAVFS
jgi:hypothetical protein